MKSPANFVGLLVAAFALASASAHSSIPFAYAATTTTTTVSANTTFTSLVVSQGDTLVINPGVEVGAQAVTNNGTIINRGTLIAGTFVNGGTMDIHGLFAFTGEGSNDGGTVNVHGTLRFEGVYGDFYNKDGGAVNVKENARFEFWRQGSYRPHDLYNGANSLVDNYGAVALTGYTGMRILNEGTLYDQCTGTYSVPVTGNSIVDKCAPSKEHTLTVKSTGLGSSAISGMWTVIRAGDGTVVKTGYTPLAFTGPAGEYRIKVSNYDGRIFSSWEDGSTSRERKVALSADATVTARYDPGDSLRGYTGLTFTGTQEQPDLAVKAVKTGGSSQELRIWTIIDPQTTGASGTTYKVFVHSYKDRMFDHWDDGSTSRIRMVTIDESTTITAYYKTG